ATSGSGHGTAGRQFIDPRATVGCCGKLLAYGNPGLVAVPTGRPAGNGGSDRGKVHPGPHPDSRPWRTTTCFRQRGVPPRNPFGAITAGRSRRRRVGGRSKASGLDSGGPR